MSDETAATPTPSAKLSPAAGVSPAKAKPLKPAKSAFTGKPRVWFKDPVSGERKLGGGED